MVETRPVVAVKVAAENCGVIAKISFIETRLESGKSALIRRRRLHVPRRHHRRVQLHARWEIRATPPPRR